MVTEGEEEGRPVEVGPAAPAEEVVAAGGTDELEPWVVVVVTELQAAVDRAMASTTALRPTRRILVLSAPGRVAVREPLCRSFLCHLMMSSLLSRLPIEAQLSTAATYASLRTRRQKRPSPSRSPSWAT